MSNLQVGQKVVCINDRGWVSQGGAGPVSPNLPQYKGVYTIRAVRAADDRSVAAVLLDEVRNEPIPPYTEQYFMAACFRPVVERKTDISIFQAMLTPKQVPVEVA